MCTKFFYFNFFSNFNSSNKWTPFSFWLCHTWDYYCRNRVWGSQWLHCFQCYQGSMILGWILALEIQSEYKLGCFLNQVISKARVPMSYWHLCLFNQLNLLRPTLVVLNLWLFNESNQSYLSLVILSLWLFIQNDLTNLHHHVLSMCFLSVQILYTHPLRRIHVGWLRWWSHFYAFVRDLTIALRVWN